MDQNFKFCTECGSRVDGAYTRCPNCGAQLESTSVKSPQQPAQGQQPYGGTPYGGQYQQPVQQRPVQQPAQYNYGQPSQVNQQPQYSQPSYQQQYSQGGYGQQGAPYNPYGQGTGQKKKGANGVLIAIIAVLVLALVGAGIFLIPKLLDSGDVAGPGTAVTPTTAPQNPTPTEKPGLKEANLIGTYQGVYEFTQLINAENDPDYENIKALLGKEIPCYLKITTLSNGQGSFAISFGDENSYVDATPFQYRNGSMTATIQENGGQTTVDATITESGGKITIEGECVGTVMYQGKQESIVMAFSVEK